MFAEKNVLNYLCNILVLIEVSYVTNTFGVTYNEYVVDQGKNLTLPCSSKNPVMWVREGKKEDNFQEIQSDGSLVLTHITANDSGTYSCSTIITSPTTAMNDDDMNGDNNSYHIDNTSSRNQSDADEIFIEISKVSVKVRTPPLAVSHFFVRASTIIAVLVWEVMPNRTGGYAIKDFTTEMRRLVDYDIVGVAEEPWERLDPHHISPNARQLEIYHLIPNTTYEFRIWANNQLGSGEIVTITGTTTPKMDEKDLIRRIMLDAQNFDTRVWIAAVGVVMGTLVILSLGTCIVLYKECRESTGTKNTFYYYS